RFWRKIRGTQAMKKAIPFVIALAGIVTLATFMTVSGGRAPANAPVEFRPAWTEFQWPFLLDQWGVGRTFVCKPADCGTEVKVYLRPKNGSCNCAPDDIEDEELDRVGDTELVAPVAVPSGLGRSVQIAWMKGRSRTFEKTDTAGDRLLSIAFH